MRDQHINFISFYAPHGWLILLCLIFAIGGVIRWGAPSPGRVNLAALNWFSWSWLFFVCSLIFGP